MLDDAQCCTSKLIPSLKNTELNCLPLENARRQLHRRVRRAETIDGVLKDRSDFASPNCLDLLLAEHLLRRI